MVLKVTLENYNTLFVIFLIITIILFIVLIVFFFVFDIRKIISIKTGWAVKQSMKELNEINQREDNRQRKKYKGHSIQFNKSQSKDFLENDLNIVDKEDNSIAEKDFIQGEESIATVTIELEQEDKGTILLETDRKSDSSSEIEDSGKELKREPFNIFESKVIMFSSEIITKQGIISEK